MKYEKIKLIDYQEIEVKKSIKIKRNQ